MTLLQPRVKDPDEDSSILHSLILFELSLGTSCFRWLMLEKLSPTLNVTIGHHTFIVYLYKKQLDALNESFLLIVIFILFSRGCN